MSEEQEEPTKQPNSLDPFSTVDRFAREFDKGSLSSRLGIGKNYVDTEDDQPAGPTGEQKINRVVYIFIAILLVIAIVSFYLSISPDTSEYKQTKSYAFASRKWPSVIGTINDSSVSYDFGVGRSLSYFVPHVEYQYSVNGQTYTRHRISFPSPRYLDNREADKLRDHFPKDSKVKVYYDPKDPSTSCIMNGVTDAIRYTVPWRADDHTNDPQ